MVAGACAAFVGLHSCLAHVQMLGLMEEDPQPSHFAVVFDARGKNFRSDHLPQLGQLNLGSGIPATAFQPQIAIGIVPCMSQPHGA